MSEVGEGGEGGAKKDLPYLILDILRSLTMAAIMDWNLLSQHQNVGL